MPRIRRAHFCFSIFAILLFVAFLRSRSTILDEIFPGDAYFPAMRKEMPVAPDTSIPTESTILGVAAVPGFTLFDRLYLRNGTFYVVSSDTTSLPPRRNILAPPVDVGKGHDMEPTDRVSASFLHLKLIVSLVR